MQQALARIPDLDFCAEGSPPSPIPTKFFSRVWLGLAGVLHKRDIEEIAPQIQAAFGFAPGDSALQISNGASFSRPFTVEQLRGAQRTESAPMPDGYLLAAPSLALEHIDSTVALVAGTGSVNLGRSSGACVWLSLLTSFLFLPVFRKVAGKIQLGGMSGGWGYL